MVAFIKFKDLNGVAVAWIRRPQRLKINTNNKTQMSHKEIQKATMEVSQDICCVGLLLQGHGIKK